MLVLGERTPLICLINHMLLNISLKKWQRRVNLLLVPLNLSLHVFLLRKHYLLRLRRFIRLRNIERRRLGQLIQRLVLLLLNRLFIVLCSMDLLEGWSSRKILLG